MSMAALLRLTASLWLAASVLAWEHSSGTEFRNALQSQEYTLAAFILPEHTASEALEPEWKTVQESKHGSKALSIDCNAEQILCAELDVASPPVIRLYHGSGIMTRYRGPRKATPLIKFVERALRPRISHVDASNVTNFVALDDVVIVGQIADADTSVRERFEKTATKYYDRYSFGLLGASTTTELECYNHPENVKRSVFRLSTVHALEEWIESCVQPLIPELTRRNELTLLSSGKSVVHYFAATDEEREGFVGKMRPLAQKYSEYLQFDTIDALEYGDMLQAAGFEEGAHGVLAVHNPGQGQMFPYRGSRTISAEVVEEFLNDIVEGRVEEGTGRRVEEMKHEEL